jgi:hypothetical protein
VEIYLFVRRLMSSANVLTQKLAWEQRKKLNANEIQRLQQIPNIGFVFLSLSEISEAKTKIILALKLAQRLYLQADKNFGEDRTFRVALLLYTRFFLKSELALNECLSKSLSVAQKICQNVRLKYEKLRKHERARVEDHDQEFIKGFNHSPYQKATRLDMDLTFVFDFFIRNFLSDNMLSWDGAMLFDVMHEKIKLQLIGDKVKIKVGFALDSIVLLRSNSPDATAANVLKRELGVFEQNNGKSRPGDMSEEHWCIQRAACHFNMNIMLFMAPGTTKRFFKDEFDIWEKSYRKLDYDKFDWYMSQEGGAFSAVVSSSPPS